MFCFRRAYLSLGLIAGLAGYVHAQAAPPTAPLPVGATARLGSARIAHGQSASALALSPDGTILASASADQNYRVNVGGAVDHSICLWELATGRQLHHLAGHTNGATNLVFSPDGKLLASAGRDTMIKVWDAGSGKMLHQFKAQPALGALALVFAPDGQFLASGGSDKTLKIWEVAGGREVNSFQGHQTSVVSLAYSADGRMLASGCMDGSIRLWEAATGQELGSIAAHRQEISTLAFTPDGKTLASGSRDGMLRLWEVADGKEFRTLGEGLDTNGQLDRCSRLTFSADGKTLVSAWNEGLYFRIWDATGAKELRQFQAPFRYGQFSIAFSADGAVIVTGQRNGGQIYIWDATTGQERRYEGHEREVVSVAFNPDGQTVATGSNDRSIRLWQAGSGKEIRTLVGHSDPPRYLAFSPDGKLLASAGTSDLAISLWDIALGKEIRQIRGHVFINAIAFTADGQTLVGAGGDGDQAEQTVWQWDVATGKERRQFKSQRGYMMALASDGKLLASAGNTVNGESQVKIYDVDSGKESQTLSLPPNPRVSGLAFAPGGKLLALGGQTQMVDGNGNATLKRFVGIWDVTTGRQYLQSLDQSPPSNNFNYYGAGFSLAFSADGRMLATASGERPNRTINLWEIATGKLRRQFTGHQREISALALSPDGKALISGSGDATGLIWNVLGVDANAPAKLNAQELAQLENDLAGGDGPKAFRAICLLARLHEQSLPYLQSRLQPVPSIDPQHVEKLIKDLDSGSFAVRSQASDELEKLAELAQPALAGVLDGKPSLEVRQRVEQLLDRLHARALLPQQVKAIRAIEVLEKIGTPEARQTLEALAKGAGGARITQDAQIAVKRLAK